MTDEEERIPLAFFRTEAGAEPVREWLLELPAADRKTVGEGLKDLEYGWPVGMPLCKALGKGAYSNCGYHFQVGASRA